MWWDELNIFTSGLICLDWYDWNVSSLFFELNTELNLSGLICLDWYDWNEIGLSTNHQALIYSRDWSVWIDTIETPKTIGNHLCHRVVGIDLFGLIRLKHGRSSSSFSVRTLVGIDLFGLIRLKLAFLRISFTWVGKRRDWSVWIDTIETKRSYAQQWYCMECRDWSVWIDTIETTCHAKSEVFYDAVGIDLFGLIRLKPFSVFMCWLAKSL